MAAGQYDILIEQGATFNLDMAVRSQPTVAFPNGQAVDLTGVIVSGQIRPVAESDIILAEFDGVVGSPLTGTISLTITDEATKAIDAVTYPDGVYDVLMQFPNGMVRRLIQGNVQISPGVTR